MTGAGKMIGVLVFSAAAACSGPDEVTSEKSWKSAPTDVRVALFNIRELKTEKLLDVDDRWTWQGSARPGRGPHHPAVEPDILVLNEIDHDYEQAIRVSISTPGAFGTSISPQETKTSICRTALRWPTTPAFFQGSISMATATSPDDDRGTRDHGNDSLGYGTYPGEYSMAVLSRFPMLEDESRTFQKLLWKDLPGHHIPPGLLLGGGSAKRSDCRASLTGIYRSTLMAGLCISSFSSDAAGLRRRGRQERRRNFDEIKLWVEYLELETNLTDDQGVGGGYRSSDPFVIVGDLNAAPLVEGRRARDRFASRSMTGRRQSINCSSIRAFRTAGRSLTSRGASITGRRRRISQDLRGSSERSTSVFGQGARIDYILPSKNLEIAGGVFWPSPDEDPEGASWADDASDHRLVWLDIRIGRGGELEAGQCESRRLKSRKTPRR